MVEALGAQAAVALQELRRLPQIMQTMLRLLPLMTPQGPLHTILTSPPYA